MIFQTVGGEETDTFCRIWFRLDAGDIAYCLFMVYKFTGNGPEGTTESD